VVWIVFYTTEFWLFIAVSLLAILSIDEFKRLVPGARAGAGARGPAGWAMTVLGVLAVAAVYSGGTALALPVVVATPFCLFTLKMVSGAGARDADTAPGAEFRDSAASAAFGALGVAYLALPLSYLVLIKGLPGGEWWIMFLMLIIWANDTFAYFTGRAVGRTRLSPAISPKKTIEGAAGGLVGGAAASLIFNHLFGLGMDVLPAIVLSVVIGVVAIIGDLAESVLKRAAGVKDSGALIPGHGGILDRIDSLLFAIPVIYYFMLWQPRL